MTIISAILEKSYTVHATDSLLTFEENGNKLVSEQSGRGKMVYFSRLHGAASYWGSVTASQFGGTLDARKLLIDRAVALKSHVEKINLDNYMGEIANEMNVLFKDSRIQQKGLGIHFTVMEEVEGIGVVPELYLITNFTGDYSTVPQFESQRQTFFILSEQKNYDFKHHHEKDYRDKVRNHVEVGNAFFFNNGQPALAEKSLPNVNGPHTSATPLEFVRDVVDKHELETAPDQRVVGHPCVDLIVPLKGTAWSHVGMHLIDGI